VTPEPLNPRIPGHLAALKAREAPDTPILTFEGLTGNGPDEVVTYRDLWERSARLGLALGAGGIGPGDTVALFARNHPEFVYGMIACSIAGAVFVPIDPRSRGAKLRYQLVHAECRAVVSTTDLAGALGEVAADSPALRLVLLGERGGAPLGATVGRLPVVSLADVLAGPMPEPPPQRVTDPRHPIQIIYTSGTTGDPKGVVGETGRWTGTAELLAHCFGYRPDDRLYTGLSLTHGNAQAVTLMPALQREIPAVISPRFTKSRIWEVCRRYGCTTFSLLGGMMAAIYAEPARPDDAENPVRFVLSAGTPRAIWESFERRFGVDILEWYGAVEGGFAFRPIGEGPIGSFGRAVPGVLEMRIVDEHDHECAPGEVGELISRAVGGETRVEYLKNPEASAAKTRGGWLRSGDMCRRDADGWLFFSHRKGSEIRHNGEFIQPDFVEKVLAEDPQVSDVYVYGVPAASGAPGEKDVVAAVVPADPARFDARRVFRVLGERLERSHVPTYLQVLAEIPKTASEKPQERFLVADLEARRGNVHLFEG
jgi:crotonobetaine/carnitine-CoA ligase